MVSEEELLCVLAAVMIQKKKNKGIVSEGFRGGYSFLKRSVKTLAKLRPQSWLPLLLAIKKNPCE